MKNPIRSILEYRRKIIADREAFEAWEDRIVDPILGSGKDQLLAEVYKQRNRAFWVSFLIGPFFVVALVAYVIRDASWISDARFYMILAVCVIGVAWTIREVVHSIRCSVEKMAQWKAKNATYYKRPEATGKSDSE